MAIYCVKKGCAVCGRDLLGNRKQKYFCKHCNLLYPEEYIKRMKLKKELT